MKIKALVTTLILGTSSIAMAKPAYPIDWNANADVQFRDRRPMRPIWTTLSDSVTASSRNVIRLDDRTDNLQAIRLQNGSGATYVYSIALRFDDGTRQTITVGKWLFAGAPLLTFPIEQSKSLARMTVQTWTSAPSTYSVLGQQATRFRPPIGQPPIGQPLPPPPPLPVQHATLIGSDLSFASAGYVHLPVGLDKGRFSALRLEGFGASSFIDRVFVTFANGNQQLINVNKSLARGQAADFDLEGGANGITSVTVLAQNGIVPSTGRFNVSLL